MPASETPKLAFKGGFSLSSKASSKPLSAATKPSNIPSSSLGKRPRARLTYDSDSEDERPVKHESITAFNDGKAIAVERKQERQTLIIQPLKTRDWRQEMRRVKSGRNVLPHEVAAARESGDAEREGQTTFETTRGDGHQPVKWGLTVSKKETVPHDKTVEVRTTQVHVEKAEGPDGPEEANMQREEEKTDDQRAVEALLGIKPETTNAAFIIGPAVTAEASQPGLNQEDSYRKAIQNAPDVSSLEDYERIPVEDFGAALLRGMGWKGDYQQNRIEKPKRANRLGLGAKELENPEDLGAWNQGGSKPRHTDRRPRANEYKEKQDRRRSERDERYGSHRGEEEYVRSDGGHRAGNGDRDRDRNRHGDRRR